MAFDGLGQSLFDDAKKIGLLTAYLEMVEDGSMSIEKVCSSLNITVEDYDKIKDQVKALKKSIDTMDYLKFMEFRNKYQSILNKMPNGKSVF